MKFSSALFVMIFLLNIVFAGILPLHTGGNDFWVAFPENIDSGVSLTVVVTGPPNAVVHVEIPGLGISQAFSIAGSGSIEINIPVAAMATGSGVIAEKGIHISSVLPISLMGISMGQASGDAFLALPVNLLDVEYRVMSYPPSGNTPSQFVIVAAYPNTEVTITPPDGMEQQITLQKGQTYSWQSTTQDLTGTWILASRPVAVFSGHACAEIPQNAGGCSFVVEQLPPLTTWGSAFVTAPLATRQNGDAFRILAAEDNTDVFLNNSFLVTLNQGEFYEMNLTEPSFITSSNDKPLLIAQFSHSQSYDGVSASPFMTIISPWERLFSRTNFSIPPGKGYTGYINIVTPTTNIDSVRLDGTLIDSQTFQTISNTEFSSARLSVSPGTHVVNVPRKGKLGVHVYAFSDGAQGSKSFGYPGEWTFPGFVNVVTEQQSDQGVILRVTPPRHFNSAFNLLGYRYVGERRYRVLLLQPQGNTLEGRIPFINSLEQGIEYYVSLSDSVVTRFYPPVDPENFPASLNLILNNYVSPHLHLENGVYKMVSVPLRLKHPQLTALFQDDYGEYNPADWRLFRWMDDNSGYVEFPDLPPDIHPGNAYWLITRTGNRFDVDSAFTVSSKEPVNIVLSPGWNQVGNPFPFPVAWDSLSATGMVKGPYYYDGIEFKIADVLNPWEGYFIRNEESEAITLQVPAVSVTPKNLAKDDKPISWQFPGMSYLLQLSAEIPDARFRDTQNFVGWSPEASYGVDRFDYPEPPPVESALRLSILEDGSRFLSNFKPTPQDGQVWEFALEVPRVPVNVALQLNAETMLPETFDIFLMDMDVYQPIPITGGTAVVQYEKNGARTRHFKLIVGTPSFAEKNSGGISLFPTAFQLEQNYPNPFNPSTAISYQLPAVSRVRLEIYNLLGQKVRTLVDQQQPGGRYTVEWNGRDENGSEVSSGVYFYRLSVSPPGGNISPGSQSREDVLTRKMVLLR